MILAVGMITMLVCLALQALASVLAARIFVRSARRSLGRRPARAIFSQLGALLVVLMLGNVVQIEIWALLYRVFGAFPDFETASYFSGVTFTSLGYGDVLLEGRVRLLAPLQAANGLMMFGVTTALFYAAFQRATAKLAGDAPDALKT